VELSSREVWTLIHGMVIGSLFLLAFAGGLAGLWSLQRRLVTLAGIKERMVRLKTGTTVMALMAWATVLTGTWVVYPWYRENLAGDDQAGCAGLQAPSDACSPRDFLISNVSGNTEDWHRFGMEWKEHVAWISPMLATVAMVTVLYYGGGLARNRTARLIAIGFFVAAFVVAAVAGLFGALITKAAPIR
jgi:hypothetical protein